jgi:lia operon protein LiaG
MVLAAAVLLASAACAVGGPVTTETRDDTFAVNGSAVLVVSSENGWIQVVTGSDDEVRVEATLRGPDRIDYEVSQDGNTITVEANVHSGWTIGNRGADIMITAPVNTSVDLSSSNGMIGINGTEGNGEFETSNGMISVEDVKGDFEGTTSNGLIRVTGMEGDGVFRSSNGAAELAGVTGEFDVETSNGGISFSGNLTAGGSNRLVTSNGNVVVELLGTPSVNLDASTSNGDITCEMPITATVTGDDHLVGTIGDGEADLEVSSSNGDVIIR